ncbi:MAG: M15 family metallopeptidase [Clostridia bacterium]|nr:M15 family metallopeptidase [Clostridia bacterium]
MQKRKSIRKKRRVQRIRQAYLLGLSLLALLCAFFPRPDTPQLTSIRFTETGIPLPEDTPHHSLQTDWNLLLVNRWHTVPQDFSVDLTKLRNGHAIDRRAYSDLQAMMDAMRAAGLSPLICSSYRTHEDQEKLYADQTAKFLSQGYSQADAEAEAAKLVALPGTSEHQIGLAVDIVDISYQLLETNQENTQVQIWLHKNSWQYGFILRYPRDKTELTGKSYEPWHYRYVGKDAARDIYQNGLCLEEYLSDVHR